MLIPVVLLGFIGNATNGAMCVYNGTLDLQAILWRLRRVDVGFLFGLAGLAVAYVAVLIFGAAKSIESLITIVTVLVTPWMAINIIGYLRARGRFLPHHLQAFANRSQRGIYWYRGGVNWRAVVAWLAGVILGLMFSNTSLLNGPLSSSFNGVELSFVASAVVAGVIYIILSVGTRQPVDASGSAGPNVPVDVQIADAGAGPLMG